MLQAMQRNVCAVTLESTDNSIFIFISIGYKPFWWVAHSMLLSGHFTGNAPSTKTYSTAGGRGDERR
jgi:hypothetical protein